MDPNNQAERWLGIAAKLLTARDFLGSKTFAIRARDSDPNNEVSDQILAVVETVLAGEKRVNVSQHPDWYSVLQLPRLVRDPELIASHYRRLVVLLNPERNRFPFADYALQLVMDAWSILSDPNKKWLFDNDLAVYLQRVEQQQQPPQSQPPPQQQQQQVQVQVQQPVVGNSELNTFQFFQQPVQVQQPVQAPPPHTVAMSMWEQQQHQQQQEHFLNNSQQQRQHNQIEFMQPQQPPPPQQQPPQQQQQLPPQWQVRDPAVSRGGDRNKGILNVLGGGMEMNTNAPLDSTPIMRRVADVAPQVTTMVTPTQIPTHTQAQAQVQVQTQPQPQPQPQPEPEVVQGRVAATVRATYRVVDGNVVNVSNAGNVAANNVAGSNVINNNNNNHNNADNFVAGGNVNVSNAGNVASNVAANNVGGNVAGSVDDAVNESGDVRVENGEKFWTSCPYCYYLYEYPKVYVDCTLRCQNCRRGFHAIQVANPPLDGGEKGERSSFNSWGFVPLGFSTTTWKKNNRMGASNVAKNWVPFSPMFACPAEKGVENFEWFASSDGGAIGPKNVGRPPASRPRVFVIDDEDGDFVSDPSDSDSSDQDWRRNPAHEKKRKKFKRGNYGSVKRPRIVKQQNVAVQNKVNRNPGTRVGVSASGVSLAYGSGTYDIVMGLTANPKGSAARVSAARVGKATVGARKKVAASISRNQTKRKVKNMGKLDLNVEFNNEGDEQAPAVSAVNGEEDAINNIGFFEGLDEFFSTLPILNVGGEEKANKPS